MRASGFVDGQNVAIELRYGAPQQLPELAAELIRLKVDVIFASGDLAPVARQRLLVGAIERMGPALEGSIAAYARERASALAAAMGKTSASAATAVPAPTSLKKSRRLPKTACSTERSTSRSMRASVLCGLSSIEQPPGDFRLVGTTP